MKKAHSKTRLEDDKEHPQLNFKTKSFVKFDISEILTERFRFKNE
jgi:hypothetical protein